MTPEPAPPVDLPAPALPEASALPEPRRHWRQRLASLRWMQVPFVLWLGSRAAIMLVAQFGLRLEPQLYRGGGVLKLPAVDGLCWWDCAWYGSIAEKGYQEPLWAAFFPLFPLLGRGMHELSGLSYPHSMVLVGNLLGLLGLLITYRLFSELEGEEVAGSALALLVAWPFSFFQAAGYPESLMFASTAGAVYLAYHQRHLLAGLVLGLGALGRHLTIVAGGALLVAQLLERGRKPLRLVFHRDFLGLLLPFGVVGLFPLYLWYRFDDPLKFSHARTEGWGEIAWQGLGAYFRGELQQAQFHAYVAFSGVVGIGSLLLLARKKWWILAGFASALMVTVWVIGVAALGRYTQSCWPAFLPMAVYLSRFPTLRTALLVGFAMFQAVFLWLFTHSFPIN